MRLPRRTGSLRLPIAAGKAVERRAAKARGGRQLPERKQGKAASGIPPVVLESCPSLWVSLVSVFCL